MSTEIPVEPHEPPAEIDSGLLASTIIQLGNLIGIPNEFGTHYPTEDLDPPVSMDLYRGATQRVIYPEGFLPFVELSDEIGKQFGIVVWNRTKPDGTMSIDTIMRTPRPGDPHRLEASLSGAGERGDYLLAFDGEKGREFTYLDEEELLDVRVVVKGANNGVVFQPSTTRLHNGLPQLMLPGIITVAGGYR